MSVGADTITQVEMRDLLEAVRITSKVLTRDELYAIFYILAQAVGRYEKEEEVGNENHRRAGARII